ncbi:FAD binding domain-containing protein [Hirsutella rhossiliensis]|uniref:FAD binding domain-containing protein n=1 Tax=Hirsutella rhossiliensis TaxID=111463 RepID=A0A9P8SFL7_9HYPO|nr:FAD binding domain-containing protein [Hirsutella rhossiliensis]KAH0960169.1 FAD binding domain-containing protein [Hirsutella rhossiliensis]
MHCSLVAASSLVLTIAIPVLANVQGSDCKCFPGDSCWPRPGDWARLNETVGGRLIATVPLASPCHVPNYDARACSALRRQRHHQEIHMKSSSSVMSPLFANRTCDPFRARSEPCVLGNYVRYAVDARGPDAIIAALGFAAEHNIRFVIRNTGHDYLGRSTGAGALAVWTHHLKAIQVLDWADERYVGKALKVGAGVQGFEALEAARNAGLVVVTGSCPSVGLAGGYTQGGGHSPLSTVYGLAADNALSFDVVTPSGRLVTASPSAQRDLFWALSGGGGGNYGVVVSATVKAHPDAVVSGASFQLTIRPGEEERLLGAVDAFHAALPAMVDAGVMIMYRFSRNFIEGLGMTAYNMTKPQARLVLQPFLEVVATVGLPIKAEFTEFSCYHDHLSHYFGPPPRGNIGVGISLYGGRLIPRPALAGFSPAARRLVGMQATVVGVGLDVSRFGPPATTNAVLPQWRSAIALAIITLPWNFDKPYELMAAEQDCITRELQPAIEAATPGAGAYMNEADFQEAFFGDNYPALLRIKKRYHPRGLLYAKAGVGSEEWLVKGDGRLCRVATRGRAFLRHDATPVDLGLLTEVSRETGRGARDGNSRVGWKD